MWPAGERNMAAAVVQMSLGYRGLLAVRSRALGPLGLGIVSPQLRAFSVRKEPELEENPYYGKYRDKIQQLRRTDPAAFDTRMEKKNEVKKQPLGYSKQAEFARAVEEKVGTDSAKGGFTRNKTLSSILNVELVKDKSTEEIKQIWKQYFSTRDTVYAVIPGESFEVIWQRAQACPAFLYALPREHGYEFFVGQWSGTELHFTSLINIQTAGDSAPSQLILYHYTDFQKQNGIVLMTSEIDSKFLNVQEAQCLANQVQLFYATDRPEAFGLVETFNRNPSEFKYMSVVSSLEENGLGKSTKSIREEK
ncbi:ATP synthase mitochondrial F1 complex assembly factor 1 [Spea bombifrons]|uniref:ATP synthase mitochondrial F1 complex assembly factor 1 n=1 Tax=Spea bombifrons TaxID=233779 RepID=UPI00234B0214|nr:ATP synthase mitochondrial F1 complex assembly factor 1 [Spea bombifrons]